MKLINVLNLVIGISMLSGCTVGNDATSHYYTRTSSIGQELIDLQKAKDSNTITDVEFEKAKQALLDSVAMPANNMTTTYIKTRN